ncbi:2Fe-2S iron-sulfur cluster-binding protein [Larkinella insperata]|uniref:2Fe-2S iron-sulfur cluster-binding protein n=1 Tax=Larkinella insperata TaxID=332158 RepID=A0ABW3Q7E0_9BACT
MKLNVTINGVANAFDVDSDMPLLWLIRDEAKLKGTKFGCGMGVCGACSVHVDGELIRSCSYPAQLVAGKNITTIEGLSADKNHVHPVQQAWMDVQYEEATIENSQFTQTSFHTYQVARLTDTPEIEVIIQESSELPSGVGEPPLSPVAPAIANAIYNLTGFRLRSLPLQAALDKQYQKTGK